MARKFDKLCALLFDAFVSIGKEAVKEGDVSRSEYENFIRGWSKDSRGIRKAAEAAYDEIEELFFSELSKTED